MTRVVTRLRFCFPADGCFRNLPRPKSSKATIVPDAPRSPFLPRPGGPGLSFHVHTLNQLSSLNRRAFMQLPGHFCLCKGPNQVQMCFYSASGTIEPMLQRGNQEGTALSSQFQPRDFKNPVSGGKMGPWWRPQPLASDINVRFSFLEK